MAQFIVDIHCHPSLKPYGHSFSSRKPGENSANRRHKKSIWYYDPPNIFERALHSLAGLVKFTQSDCTTLAYGQTHLICASLYPIERPFFTNKLGTGLVGDLIDNLAAGVGAERVDFIQSINDYFSDLCNEYEYYKQLDGKEVNTEAGKFRYKLIASYADILRYQTEYPNDNHIVFIAVTIEGLHVLDGNIDGKPDENKFLKNVKTIKKWEHPPFFITFAHHFYNKLCGHAQSLTGIIGGVVDQHEGMNTGFTPLGKKVLKSLLNTTNGKRILIDVKHMSALARKQYFEILREQYANDPIPVIASHCALNGLESIENKVVGLKETGHKLLHADINLYDEEMVFIARSNGIVGLQLDERRIANKVTLDNTKHSLFMNKIRHYRSALLWNQVQHIVELLDAHDLFAWDCIAIGSDFDGIINPLNGFLTSEVMGDLQAYLERHAYNYMNNRGKVILKSYNQIGADEIVNRVFSNNALMFMQKWFV